MGINSLQMTPLLLFINHIYVTTSKNIPLGSKNVSQRYFRRGASWV